jgi:hypothetical protein
MTGKDMPEEKMMVSFRIDREDWNRFGELAKMERLTATQILVDYVKRCLERGKSQYGVRDDSETFTISTGNDDVIQAIAPARAYAIASSRTYAIESQVSTHHDTVLTMVEEKISTCHDTVLTMVEEKVRTCHDTVLTMVEEKVRTCHDTVLTMVEEKVRTLVAKAIAPARAYAIGETSQPEQIGLEIEESIAPAIANNPQTVDSDQIEIEGVSTASKSIPDEEKINYKLKKFLNLSEADRGEVIRLLGDEIPTKERNLGMTAIFGWSDKKSEKSKGEDCSRLKKLLRDEGLFDRLGDDRP